MFRRSPKTGLAWLVRLNAGPLSPADRRALMRWLAADPDHLQELEAAEALHQRMTGLAGNAAARDRLLADVRAHRAARASSPPRFVLPLGAAAAAALLAFIFLPQPDPSGLPRIDNHAGAQTGLGQIARFMLPDKSEITVAANSAVAVDFSSGRRDITLDRGEAFFDVQHDQDRPFVVAAGGRTITVTGTRFNVNRIVNDQLEVAVVEGHVNVAYRTEGGERGLEQMHAGDVVYFPASGVPLRRALPAEQAAAWRSRKLYFDGAHLDQVIAEVNRYSAKPLVPDIRDIAQLMLTGQFQAGDVASVLFSLRQLYGIEARETATQWVLRRGSKP